MQGLKHSGRSGNVRARASLQLSVLGAFELLAEGRPVALPMSAQRLVAFLALQGGPLRRLLVSGKLWPDVDEERGGANLRTALWRAHRPGHELVDTVNGHLALARSVAVDAREMAARTRRLVRQPPDCEDTDLEQLCLAGELLADWYDDWVLLERERLRELRARALESLCDEFLVGRRFGEAAEAGLAAVASEPLRESAHRALIRVYLAEGNRCEAIRQYGIYRDLVRSAFGIEPSGQIIGLVGGGK